MKKIFLISLVFLMSSCTYSIIMNHTEGTASDMVDDTAAPTADVDVPINATANLTPVK